MSDQNVAAIIPSNKFPQFCFSIMAGLCGVVIGSAVGWSSPATQLMIKGNHKSDEYFSDTGDDASSTSDDGLGQIAFNTVGCFCLGSAAGGLVQGALTNAIGCQLSIVAYDAVVLVGWSVMLLIDACPAYSQAVWIGRCVQGFGAGGLGLSTATYITHITDLEIRGRAHMFHQVYVCLGVLYSYVLGSTFSYSKFVAACMVLPTLHLIVAFFLPESPCYLYKRKKCASEVKAAMRRIKGDDFDADAGHLALRKYMESLDVPRSCSGFDTEADASLKKRVRRIVVAGVGLVTFQQLCGANAMTFHAQEVFNRLSPIDDAPVRAPIYAILLSTTQALLCLISIELVELLGRKFMLIASALGMGLCLSALIVHHALYINGCIEFSEVEWHKYIPIALVFAYSCSYSIGWGSVVMLVYTEIIYFDKWFTSLIYAYGQFVMFLVVHALFNTNILRSNTYGLWTYTASCAVSVAFVCCCVPETRGLRLNLIQAKFDDERKRYDKCSRRAEAAEE